METLKHFINITRRKKDDTSFVGIHV
jgi:hypothetical protein